MKTKLILLAQPLVRGLISLRWGMAFTPLSMGSVPVMPHLRFRSASIHIFFRIKQKECGQFYMLTTSLFDWQRKEEKILSPFGIEFQIDRAHPSTGMRDNFLLSFRNSYIPNRKEVGLEKRVAGQTRPSETPGNLFSIKGVTQISVAITKRFRIDRLGFDPNAGKACFVSGSSLNNAGRVSTIIGQKRLDRAEKTF